MANEVKIILTTDSSGAVTGLRQVSEAEDKLTEKTSTATSKMTGSWLTVAAAIAVFGAATSKVVTYVEDIAHMAGRYDMLGISMYTAGKNAGFSASQMDDLEKQLRDTGIAAIEARESLTRMAASNINLADSAKIARAAQDLAVVGGLNSSEAFQRLTYAIQSAQVEMVRTIGLNVNFENGYARLAAQLGKNAAQLTEQEKTQSRVNTVLQAAAQYTGIYEKSMSSAEKQNLSLVRIIDDYKVAFGEAFQPAYLEMVKAKTEAFKDLKDTVSDPEFKESLRYIAETFSQIYVAGAKIPAVLSDILKWLRENGSLVRSLRTMMTPGATTQTAYENTFGLSEHGVLPLGLMTPGAAQQTTQMYQNWWQQAGQPQPTKQTEPAPPMTAAELEAIRKKVVELTASVEDYKDKLIGLDPALSDSEKSMLEWNAATDKLLQTIEEAAGIPESVKKQLQEQVIGAGFQGIDLITLKEQVDEMKKYVEQAATDAADAYKWLDQQETESTLSGYDLRRASLLKEYEDRADVIGWTEQLYNALKGNLAKIDDQEKDHKEKTLRDLQDAEIAYQDAVIDLAEKNFEISKGEAIDQKLGLRREELDLLQKDYDKTVGISEKDQVRYEILTKMKRVQSDLVDLLEKQKEQTGTFTEGLTEGLNQYLHDSKTVFQEGEDLAKNAAKDSEKAFSDIFYSAVKGDLKGLEDAFKNFFDSILRNFTDMLGRMAAQDIMGAITGKGSSNGLASLFGSVAGGSGSAAAGSAAAGSGFSLSGLLSGGASLLPYAGPLAIGSMVGGSKGMGIGIGGLLGAGIAAAIPAVGTAILTTVMSAAGVTAMSASLGNILIPGIGAVVGAIIGLIIGSFFGKQSLPSIQAKYIALSDTFKFPTQNFDLTKAQTMQLQLTFDKIRGELQYFIGSMSGDVSKFSEDFKSKVMEFEKTLPLGKLLQQYADFILGIDIKFKQFKQKGEKLPDTIQRIVEGLTKLPDTVANIQDYVEAIQSGDTTLADANAKIREYTRNIAILDASIKHMTDPADAQAAGEQLMNDILDRYKAEKDLVNGIVDAINNLKIQKADLQLSLQEKISSLLGTAIENISIPSDAMDLARQRFDKATNATDRITYLNQYIGYLDKWVQDNTQAIQDKYSTEKQALQNQLDIVQKWKSISDSVSQQLNSLVTSTASPQNVLERLGLSRQNLDTLRQQYLGATGTEKADIASQLQSSITDYLNLAQQYYGRPSAPGYVDIYNEMVGWLQQIQADASTLGTGETDLLQKINDVDTQMNAELKTFNEQAAGYYQWAQSQTAIYDQAIQDQTDQLAAILGDKTVEQYLADLQKQAVDQLTDVNSTLENILDFFTKWQNNPNTADIGDIKDILKQSTNPFTKGTSEADFWSQWHKKVDSLTPDIAQSFLDSLLSETNDPFKKAMTAWQTWFDQFQNIPQMAEGAYVTRPTLAIIGERGPEWVTPANRTGNSSGGGDVTVQIGPFTVTATDEASAKETANEIGYVVRDLIKFNPEVRAALTNQRKYG